MLVGLSLVEGVLEGDTEELLLLVIEGLCDGDGLLVLVSVAEPLADEEGLELEDGVGVRVLVVLADEEALDEALVLGDGDIEGEVLGLPVFEGETLRLGKRHITSSDGKRVGAMNESTGPTLITNPSPARGPPPLTDGIPNERSETNTCPPPPIPELLVDDNCPKDPSADISNRETFEDALPKRIRAVPPPDPPRKPFRRSKLRR